MIRQLAVCVAFTFTLAACGDKIDAVKGGTCSIDLGSVTYAGQIKAILDTQCVGCHAAALSGSARSGAPPAVNLDTYSGLRSSAAASNKRIQNGSMPPGGGLPATEKALVQCWMDSGGQEK